MCIYYPLAVFQFIFWAASGFSKVFVPPATWRPIIWIILSDEEEEEWDNRRANDHIENNPAQAHPAHHRIGASVYKYGGYPTILIDTPDSTPLAIYL